MNSTSQVKEGMDEEGVELNLVGQAAVVSGLVIMSMVVLVAALLAVWVIRHRRSQVVQAKQPEFLIILLVGIILWELTLLPAGRDDTNTDEIDRACMATVWLDRMGELLVMTSLFLKLWRVNQIFHAAEALQRRVVSRQAIFNAFMAFLAFNLIILITASVVDPMVWVRVPINGDDDYSDTIGYCDNGGPVGLALTSLLHIVNLIVLITLGVQAYRAREISSDFSEARGVALAIFSLLQLTIVASPVAELTKTTDTTANYVLQVLVYTMANVSFLVFIFGPLVQDERKSKLNRGSSRLNIRTSSGSAETNQTFEQDASFYELQGAKRRIAELEAQVEALTSSGKADESENTVSDLTNTVSQQDAEDPSSVVDLTKVNRARAHNALRASFVH